MVVHQLRHRSGYATRYGFLIINLRAEVVVGCTLIPACLNERRNGGTGWRNSCRSSTNLSLMGIQPGHLLGIAVQQIAQPVGHVLLVEGAAVGIAEDVSRAVVATDDDETVVAAHVEHIVVARCGCGYRPARAFGRHFRLDGGARSPFVQKLLSFFHCVSLADAACPRRHGWEQQHSHDGHCLLHCLHCFLLIVYDSIL